MFIGYIIVASFGKYSLPNWKNYFILSKLVCEFLQPLKKKIDTKMFGLYLFSVYVCM